jgi:ABC-type antimicrobial peptide transport system permease subunit
MGLDVGDTLSFTLLGYEINTTIVGLCRDLELVFSMYIQLSTLEDILGFSPHNGMLLKVDSNEKSAVIEELNNHEEVAFALSKEKFETRIFNLFQTITIIVNVMVFLGFLVSFITIFATTFISSLEREREYALLRVFGYTSANILGQLLFEIFILCIFAMVIGLTTGNLLSVYWNSIISSLFFTIDLYGAWKDYLFSGGFALMTIIISILPAFQLIIRQILAEQIKEE